MASLAPCYQAVYGRDVWQKSQGSEPRTLVDRPWLSVFAQETCPLGPLNQLSTRDCARAAQNLAQTNEHWKQNLMCLLCSNIGSAGAVDVFASLYVLAEHSKTVRKKLSADMELLDLLATRIMDSCISLSSQIPLNENCRMYGVYVEACVVFRYVSLLEMVVSEDSRAWLKHIQKPDRAARFLPEI